MNNNLEPGFSDKELHFLVIGLVGMVLTFVIEIGQKVTTTGTMDFADIVFGVGGFLAGFAIYFLLALLWKLLRRLFRKK